VVKVIVRNSSCPIERLIMENGILRETGAIEVGGRQSRNVAAYWLRGCDCGTAELSVLRSQRWKRRINLRSGMEGKLYLISPDQLLRLEQRTGNGQPK
jgi:hypothetical protein